GGVPAVCDGEAGLILDVTYSTNSMHSSTPERQVACKSARPLSKVRLHRASNAPPVAENAMLLDGLQSNPSCRLPLNVSALARCRRVCGKIKYGRGA
ncbi:unnamed protein product, partial [Pylaiella littoralis]